ncbi:extensin-like [Hyalella azteca]|uniref:Extensin-like n=1 Tax=Hyalella azteca TaxID=294128 RepID=A0A8B7PCN9_HYAAZ|nr:extensin-like [Hyalella azteca]
MGGDERSRDGRSGDEKSRDERSRDERSGDERSRDDKLGCTNKPREVLKTLPLRPSFANSISEASTCSVEHPLPPESDRYAIKYQEALQETVSPGHIWLKIQDTEVLEFTKALDTPSPPRARLWSHPPPPHEWRGPRVAPLAGQPRPPAPSRSPRWSLSGNYFNSPTLTCWSRMRRTSSVITPRYHPLNHQTNYTHINPFTLPPALPSIHPTFYLSSHPPVHPSSRLPILPSFRPPVYSPTQRPMGARVPTFLSCHQCPHSCPAISALIPHLPSVPSFLSCDQCPHSFPAISALTPSLPSVPSLLPCHQCPHSFPTISALIPVLPSVPSFLPYYQCPHSLPALSTIPFFYVTCPYSVIFRRFAI